MKLIVRSAEAVRTIEFFERRNLLELLREHGFAIAARCGGNGTCGKCGVRLLAGALSGEVSGENFYLACRSEIAQDCEIEVYEQVAGGLTETVGHISSDRARRGYGVALDIGTTTLAFCLIDLESGRELGKKSMLNPQGAYGADVISRIKSAGEGTLRAQRDCVVRAVNTVLEEFRREYAVASISVVAAAGNTTMLHLFCGADPGGMGSVPFTPVFLETRCFAGAELGLCAEKVILLPSAHSFVGSDIICGAYCANLSQTPVAALLDIGTNGEILLHNRGKYYCTSTAAGPALEGANIACGTGGVPGAIDRVWTEGETVRFSTVGNVAPVGICGAGLVDAIAVLLQKGIIDETGAFIEGTERFDLCENVFITQQDVREFQLAKSAICAGLASLLARAGLRSGELDVLYIAGGLGYYMNIENADRVGLIEKSVAKEICVIGNSALGGAELCLLQASALAESEKIAASAAYLDLSADACFMEKYMEKMYF